MRRTNIYLGEHQLEQLDAIAKQEGSPRAEVIRRLIDRALGDDVSPASSGKQAIEESFGALREFTSADRGPDLRGAHLDRMWQLGE